jgi:hypothetical protein
VAEQLCPVHEDGADSVKLASTSHVVNASMIKNVPALFKEVSIQFLTFAGYARGTWKRIDWPAV